MKNKTYPKLTVIDSKRLPNNLLEITFLIEPKPAIREMILPLEHLSIKSKVDKKGK